MNIKQALQMPILRVLEKMGYLPVKERDHEAWFYSPFRKENTPSFHVHTLKNVWYDFGESTGGDVIKLVTTYLKHTGEDYLIPDALRWLSNMSVVVKNVQFQKPEFDNPPNPKLEVRDVRKLNHLALTKYFEFRGIPEAIACMYVKQLLILNRSTGNRFFVIGFKNEDSGWEIRNPNFKGCVAPKTISFIRSNQDLSRRINVFEGFIDFLSVAAQSKFGFLDGDSIILNSLSCMTKAYPYLREYGYHSLYSWLDNDLAGQKATNSLAEFVKTQHGLTLHRMNNQYAGFKDVNEWHMKNLGLKIN